jgi:hypothetical protein
MNNVAIHNYKPDSLNSEIHNTAILKKSYRYEEKKHIFFDILKISVHLSLKLS